MWYVLFEPLPPLKSEIQKVKVEKSEFAQQKVFLKL